MIVNDSSKVLKCSNMFSCLICNFKTSRKSQYQRHILTYKHKRNENDSKLQKNGSVLVPKSSHKYICQCGKNYKYDSGYYRHKKSCNVENNDSNSEHNEDIKESILSNKDLIMMLVKQNSQLMEVIKNGTNNTTHSNNNNTNHSHNKTFNLQFFLNETCKNAMNIGEFVSSIKPQLADLEATGRLGYVEGVSNIILNNLKTLKIHDRPIHCSDQKREVIYIKNNDEWSKEDENKTILTNAIKVIANENIKNINEWRKENSDCMNSESKKNNLYLKIVSNSMSGCSTEESSKNINKIISNVVKKVSIDKSINKIETI
jgi:hypothetical protein